MATKRILIAEDEKPLAHALALKLTHEGYDVTVAADGQECVELLISNQSSQFDLLLLDLIMPVMDGFQVLQEISKIQNKPAVFVLSNLSQQEDEKRALEAGAKKFFIKSDTPLTTIVEEVKTI